MAPILIGPSRLAGKKMFQNMLEFCNLVHILRLCVLNAPRVPINCSLLMHDLRQASTVD